jgi:hypothetical protein
MEDLLMSPAASLFLINRYIKKWLRREFGDTFSVKGVKEIKFYILKS